MRVLLIEDDLKTAGFVIKGIKESGFVMDHAVDGDEGLHMALRSHYDTAIIDIMLAKMDGLSLIEELRCNKIKMPLLILSVKRKAFPLLDIHSLASPSLPHYQIVILQ